MSVKRKDVWKWCSRYIRLRDAIAWCKERGVDIAEFAAPKDLPVACCSCGQVRSSSVLGVAGHFISRGIGGASGVYFDERNIHFQCKGCNAFKQGNAAGYRQFMLDKYGQKVIDELEFMDRTNRYTQMDLYALHAYYKTEYEKLASQVDCGGVK